MIDQRFYGLGWVRPLLVSAATVLAVAACGSGGDGNNAGTGVATGGFGGAAGMLGVTGGASGVGATGGVGGSAGMMQTGTGGVGGMTGGVGGMTGGVGGMTGGVGGSDCTAGMAAPPAGAGGAAIVPPPCGGVGGMTGGAGGVGGGPGDDPVSVALMGPHTFETYTMGLEDAMYGSAIAYYPTDADGPFAAVALSPGWTETKEQMTWWGDFLASHGFIVVLNSPNDTLADNPQARGVDLVATVAKIRAENTRAGSPLMGKVKVDAIGVSGHSMGGGGALYAAGTLGMDVQAAVGLMEHSPGGTFSHIKAPTLLLAGSADSDGLGGPNAHSIPSYESLAADTVKMLAVVNGGDHFMGINGGMHHDIIGALALAWYQVHLNGDPRYQSYIDGADFDTIAAQFSEVRP